jgi:hypothetical protein
MAKKKKKWQEPIHAEVEQAEKDFTVLEPETPQTAEDIIDEKLAAETPATPAVEGAEVAPEVQVNVNTPAPAPTSLATIRPRRRS